VARAYTEDSDWRNRTEFFKGREAIKAFLKRKWEKELDYRLMKEHPSARLLPGAGPVPRLDAAVRQGLQKIIAQIVRTSDAGRLMS
jgi:hypothetical protein